MPPWLGSVNGLTMFKSLHTRVINHVKIVDTHKMLLLALDSQTLMQLQCTQTTIAKSFFSLLSKACFSFVFNVLLKCAFSVSYNRPGKKILKLGFSGLKGYLWRFLKNLLLQTMKSFILGTKDHNLKEIKNRPSVLCACTSLMIN